MDASVRELVELAAGPDLQDEAELQRLTQWAQKGVLSVKKGQTTEDLALHEFKSRNRENLDPELLVQVKSSLSHWPRTLTRKADVLKLLVLLASSSSGTSEATLSLPTVHTPSPAAAAPAELAVAVAGALALSAKASDTTSMEETQRQLSFCFQGAESEWLRWPHSASVGAECRLTRAGEEALTANEQRLFLRVAELGGRYRRVRGSLEADPWDEALVESVGGTLKEVESMAVVLEASRMSLFQIHAWTYLLANKLGAVDAFFARAKREKRFRGGPLLTLLHPLTRPGMCHAEHLFGLYLAKLLPGLLQQIALWVSEGALPSASSSASASASASAASGFFIKEVSSGTSDAWRTRYCVAEECLPVEQLVTRATAEAILTCGKSVRFLRDFCGEREWLASASVAGLGGGSQRWLWASGSDVATEAEFRVRVAELVTETSKNNELLVSVLKHKFGLEQVLRHLHDFVVVGRGDFAQAVADVGGETLGRSATSIRRHELISILDQALRLVGDANLDGLQGVSVANLDGNTFAGDLGWDVFAVQVAMEKPVEQILSSGQLITKLRRVGNLVWKFVHAEISLAEQWREQRWNVALHEVWHVVHNLRAFISYEVIGHEWLRLRETLRDACSLDTILTAISRWSDAMLEGCFLMSDHLGILDVIHELLDVVRVNNEAEFPAVIKKLVVLLDTPKPPGRILVFDDLHAGLITKLNFNDFFRRALSN